MVEQQASRAPTMNRRIDEQGLYFAARAAQKGNRRVIWTDRDQEFGAGQIFLRHRAIDGSAIFRRHEIVRCRDRATPDFEQLRKVRQLCGADAKFAGHCRRSGATASERIIATASSRLIIF